MSDKRKFRELLIHCSFINALAKHHHIIAPNEFHLKEDDTALQNPELWIKFIEHSAYLALEAEALKLEAALEELAKRHSWNPGVGQCICQQHEYAKTVLVNFRKWRIGE